MSNKTCALCESTFDSKETVPSYLNQPPGSYVEEAFDELWLKRSDEVCARCWDDEVHPKAWKLAHAVTR